MMRRFFSVLGSTAWSPSRFPVMRRIWLACTLLALGCSGAMAAGGSYATNGTYAQSLWWLDFTGYSSAAAALAAGQPLTFTLPNGAGTLTTAVRNNGSTNLSLVSSPAWCCGGAIGRGAYDNITGTPTFYWLNQRGTATLTLSSLVMRDASSNARTFSLQAADGENTNTSSTEGIVYTSTANWRLLDTVNYFANYNGGIPNFTGVGTTIVRETGPSTNDRNFNASLIFATANPTQVSVALTGNEATLFAVSLPPVTLNLSITARLNAADQFTAGIGYTTPFASIRTASTSGAGTTATTNATSVIGTNNITLSVAMASGSVSGLFSYNSNIACTNSGPGASSYGGTNTILPTGAGTSFTLTPQTGDSISCTITLTPKVQTISGTVYSDGNYNASLDSTETGTGISNLFVKRTPSTGSACSGPATVAAPVNATTGAYTMTNVAQGNYCLILDNNATLSDITPAIPSGWVGTQNANGTVQIGVLGAAPTPQNFGLYNGSKLIGIVFTDTGVGVGTANNGVKDGSELGLAGVTVNSGASGVTSTITAGDGSYTLWVPATTTGTVTVTPILPTNYLATGGSAGTTGGSYTRPTVSYTSATGQSYTGVNFGMVPPNSLSPNNTQTAQPGTVVSYEHVFQATSGGQLTLSLANSATPSSLSWTQVLYRDSNCNGVLDSGEPQITAAITVTAAQNVCLIAKQFVPAGATSGAQNTLTLSAAFSYTNANPALTAATIIATDTTAVGLPGTLALSKLVNNVTQGGASALSVSATPGDTLQYTLTALNSGSQALSTLLINDATPAFTTYLSAACPGILPSGISACNVSTQPSVGGQGSLQWTFTGTLASGAQLIVTYQVKVGQ